MNKIFLIIKREFLSRVQKKSFLIATILTPLIFPLLIGGFIYFAVKEEQKSGPKTIEVIDESAIFNFNSGNKFIYQRLDTDIETAKAGILKSEAYGLLYIPSIEIEKPEGITFYAKSNPSVSIVSDLESELQRTIQGLRLKKFNIDSATLKNLNARVNLRAINLGEEGKEKESSAGIGYAIGYFTGFLIYIFMFVYGAQVMQGVIEEKSSKIIEIIVSSVKPFQLMMGKIIGIAAVGLTQFLIWIILITTLSSFVLSYFGLDAASQQEMLMQSAGAEAVQNPAMSPQVKNIMAAVQDVPFVKITLVFIFYFIGGYLLYAALFAAVGSAVDTPADAQQFMFPITLPIIASIIGLMFVLKDPDSNISFWLSVIPFTSPVTMMGRIAFDVPAWELILSMVMLVLGFLFTAWLAGRIYRIGILMHGTKVNFKVLAKWFSMKV
ncbi:MAG TPA: ABC transporter permease [Cyclobacteriaceae bacterium]|nr:ABC transporter permease [Cyclobacteriaceae bacterium]